MNLGFSAFGSQFSGPQTFGAPASGVSAADQRAATPASAVGAGGGPSGGSGLTANAIQQAETSAPGRSARDGTSERRASGAGGSDVELTEAEERQVRDLKKRDQEVRAHEQAHATVGGPYAGAPKYTFTTGPDGKRYAIGGEVQIDTSPERTPEATVRKMDIVIRAALAPAEPSSQDFAVARLAQGIRSDAQREIVESRQADLTGGGGGTNDGAQDTAFAARAYENNAAAAQVAQSFFGGATRI